MMIDGIKWRKPKWKFIASQLRERVDNDSNPGRGWYRIYSFHLEETVDEDALKIVCVKEEKLAMVQINIGHYRSERIPEIALIHLQQIMTFFRKQEKELILRVMYDSEGRGMEYEPSGIWLIQTHMKQIGAIFYEYADMILTLQGIFVGSWGEMHNSKFLSKHAMKTLVQTLYDATQGGCRLAVRKPSQVRILATDTMNIGLYNDGMMASESDLGTYGTKGKKLAEWEEAWRREDELEFQQEICNTVLNGGEVVGENAWSNLDEAISYMEMIHITYLNSCYDATVLEKWKNTVYNKPGVYQGISGYDYIGAHLGYRFLLKDAYLEKKKKNPILCLSIENTGFASCYDKIQIALRIKEKEMQREIPISTDLRTCKSKETVMVSTELEISLPVNMDVTIWIQMKRWKDGSPIRFANVGANDVFMLGKLFYRKTS
ncbi:MAG: DUF4832 domain-containing protein [Velocimicrobium sp.]